MGFFAAVTPFSRSPTRVKVLRPIGCAAVSMAFWGHGLLSELLPYLGNVQEEASRM